MQTCRPAPWQQNKIPANTCCNAKRWSWKLTHINVSHSKPSRNWTKNVHLPLSNDLSRVLPFFLTRVRTTVWPVCFITSWTCWLVRPWRLTPSNCSGMKGGQREDKHQWREKVSMKTSNKVANKEEKAFSESNRHRGQKMEDKQVGRKD